MRLHSCAAGCCLAAWHGQAGRGSHACDTPGMVLPVLGDPSTKGNCIKVFVVLDLVRYEYIDRSSTGTSTVRVLVPVPVYRTRTVILCIVVPVVRTRTVRVLLHRYDNSMKVYLYT
eukprot:COSAG01_NODE_10964_length_2038_cov_2.357401_2_plen_116_part_00